MAFQENNAANGAIDEWISNGSGIKNSLYACGYLGTAGCTLDFANRPVTCLLYPFKLNKNNKLVCHNWITKEKGVCKGNHNHGPMIIDVIKGNLQALFGLDQYTRVRADVISGKDSYFVVSDSILEAYKQELFWEERNEQPIPRRLYINLEVPAS
jgi:hypothetical protein